MSVALLKAILAYKIKNNITSNVQDISWSSTFTFGSEDKVCRICCEKGEIPIFSRKKKMGNIAHSINVCSHLTVSSSDGLPKYLCETCHKLLRSAMKFRNMCRRSPEKLRNLKVQKSETYLPSEPKAEPRHKNHMEESHRCMCGQIFPIKSDYYEHISKCRGKRRKYERKRVPVSYLCDICGKKSRSPAQHAIHATIHTNNFPYHCEHCPYKGRHKNMLVMHLKTHLAVKPFMCESCPTTFASTSNLKKHRAAVHQPEPVQCPHCNNIYSSKRRLTSHMENMHSSGPPMECDLCQKTYKSWKSLRKHRLSIHQVTLPKRSGRLPDYLLYELGMPKYEHIGAGKLSSNLTKSNSIICVAKQFQPSNETVGEVKDIEPPNKMVCEVQHFEPTGEVILQAHHYEPSNQFVCAPKHFEPTDELLRESRQFASSNEFVHNTNQFEPSDDLA